MTKGFFSDSQAQVNPFFNKSMEPDVMDTHNIDSIRPKPYNKEVHNHDGSLTEQRKINSHPVDSMQAFKHIMLQKRKS